MNHMRKKLLFAGILSLVIQFGATCRSKIDSLKEVAEHLPNDTNKVNILLELCKSEQNADVSQELVFGKQALELSQNLNWNKGIATANLKLGNACTIQGNFKQALDYYSKALDIYTQLDDKKPVEFCQTDLANVYSNLGDYPKALDYYRQSLEGSRTIHDTLGIIANLNSIGQVFATLGDFLTSLGYYQQASMEAQLAKDNYEMASVANNIGNLYKRLKDTSKALEYLKQSLQISSKIDNRKLKAATLLSIGKLLDKGNDSAIAYVNRALNIYTQTGNKIGTARCLEQLGLISYRKHFHATALSYSAQAGELMKQAGEQNLLAENYLQKGYIYADTALYALADSNYLECLQLAHALGIKEIERDVLDSMSQLYTSTNQPAKALTTFKQYIELRDKVMNDETAKAITLKEIEYADLKSKIEEENKKNAIERTHKLQLIGIAVFILSLIILVVLLTRIKLKHTLIKILGVFALLLVFEFLSLLVEPLIAKWTNDNPAYIFLALVAMAAILIPTHHKLEHWVKEKLTVKHHTLK